MEELFGPFGIRGFYPGQISGEFAKKVGRAVSAFFPEKDIIVGRDCRIGSDSLSKALIDGIVQQGNNVIDVGICSLPVLQFCSQEMPAVMVTASHHAKEFNGFKIFNNSSLLSWANGLGTIKDLIEKNEFKKTKKKGRISTKRSIIDKYARNVKDFAKQFVKKKPKALKAVIDAGNGTAGLAVPKIFARSPFTIIPLFFECDGNFPNRNPDPKPDQLEALRKAVRQNKADCGIAYDADSDRIAVIDEKGSLVRPDHLLVLLAGLVLELFPHAKILYDVRCSRVVKEAITELGGVAVMTRTGSLFIRDIMRDENAVLAGELGGQFYFRNGINSPNGDIAALLLLSLLGASKKPLSALVARLDKYHNSGELWLPVKDRLAVLGRLEKEYDEAKIFRIDGLTVEFEDWWFNALPGRTESIIRLNVEAKTKALLDKKTAELRRIIS
jgi:phosphomannomutase